MFSESLISSFHFGQEDSITEKIQLLSPKRLGVFTESFLRKVHNLRESDDNYHDAVDANGDRKSVV